MKKRAALGIAVLATIALTLVWRDFRATPADGFRPVTVPPYAESGSMSTGIDDLASGESLALAEISAERGALAAPALQGRVVSVATGDSIVGATVTWTSIAEGVGNPHALWVDPSSILERTEETTTDREGRFAIARAPALGAASVLWASAQDHESVSMRWLGADPGRVELSLPPRASLLVEVLDGAGAPAPGVRVVHGAYTTPYDGVADPRVRKALEVYRRELLTDARGRASIPLHAGYQAIWAESGGLRSSIWMDRARDVDSVTLRLAPTFEVYARILAANPAVEVGDLEIVVYREDQGSLRFLSRQPVDERGFVAPFALPVSSDAGYEIGLRGERIVPREVRIGPARAGESVQVELQAELGFELALEVSDPDGSPIHGARATVQLQAQGFDASPFGQSDSTGVARIRGMAAGSGFLHVDADGYRRLTSQQLHFSGPTETPLRVTLEPAGVLEGRCIGDAGPVRDFEVVVWAASGSPADFTSKAFDDRVDGSFRLEDVPVGDLKALAFSARHGLPRCEALGVRVQRDAPGRVEFRLPAPQLGRGRLIDVTTGEPPPGGFLQLWANHGGQLQRPAGDPIPVQSDGRFEIAAFGPGDVRMQASAPGYSNVIVHARAQLGSAVEFGTIGIAPLQSLRVSLTTSSHPDESGSYQVSLTGQEWHAIQEVGAGDTALFSDVSPGRWGIHVRGTGLEIDRWHDLLPGREWSVEIPIAGSATLRVRVLPAPGDRMLAGWSVEARSLGARGDRANRRAGINEVGEALFPALGSGRHALFLLDERWNERSSMEVVLDGEDRQVTLTVSRATLEVLVLSPQGLPLPGVHVQLDAADPASPWNQSAESGSEGRCTFHGLAAGEYVAGLWHAEHGWRVGIPVQLSGSVDESVELAFEEACELRARLLESGAPRAGILVHVRDSAGRYALVAQVSDEDGRIAHPSLARGTYSLLVDQPGYWPGSKVVELTDSTAEVAMEVRSTSSLAVTWPLGVGGAPIAGELDLIDVGSGERVASWLERGWIDSSTGSMGIDSEGRLQFEGLPCGTYRWSIVGGPKDGASGEIEVNRGKSALLTLGAN